MHTTRFRPGRTIWAVLGFMLLFAVLVVMVSHWYLLPALAAAAHATKEQRRAMSAPALLLLAALLVLLVGGLLLTFRLGRHFFPRPTPTVRPTRYVDAWAEAGRRVEVEREFTIEDADEDTDGQ